MSDAEEKQESSKEEVVKDPVEEVKDQVSDPVPVEFNTDGTNAEAIDHWEEVAQPGSEDKNGFKDPEIRKRGLAAANETRKKRNVSGLVVREPDYKNNLGCTLENFSPTDSMRKVLGIALELRSTKIGDWLEEAGLTRSSWYSWTGVPGFREWWNKHFLDALKSFENEWLTIGIKKMRVDFRYWAAMGEKLFGYYKHIQIENTGGEQEKALTSEILKLLTATNKELAAKPVTGTAETIELSPDDVKELNK